MNTATGLAERPPPGERENPPEIDSDTLVGDESKPGGLENLPARLQRFAGAKHRSNAMAEYLLGTVAGNANSGELSRWMKNPGPEASEPDLARFAGGKLASCGTWLEFRNYYLVNQVRLHDANFCQQPKLCPICALRRSARNLAAYLEVAEKLLLEWPAEAAPPLLYMVTLTVKNGPDLVERIGHLRTAVKRLTERRRQALSGNGWGRTEFRKVHGAVGSYEVTNIGNGWHPHVHLVMFCTGELDRLALKREWERTTGDSFMIDVQPIGSERQDMISGFVEVLKYSMKFQDMSLPDNWRAHLQLRGMRLLISLGCFRGVKEPKLTDDDLEGQVYESLFFRYLPASGVYTLRNPAKHEPTKSEERGGTRTRAEKQRSRLRIRRTKTPAEILAAVAGNLTLSSPAAGSDAPRGSRAEDAQHPAAAAAASDPTP